MANIIDSSLMLSSYQQSQRQTGSSALGKDDFLKLLITQLQNQDPTSPMDDREFIAQMAQFSTLEQITNLNSTFEKFIEQQQKSQLISYNQLLGKEVSWHKQYQLEDGTIGIEEGTGKVASLQYNDGNVQFILENGTELEPANISEVNQSMQETNMAQASMMIGKTVTYLNESNEEISDKVQSVSFKNGITSYQLADGGTSISASQMIKIE